MSALPFPLVPSPADVWQHDGPEVIGTAPAHTDLYINPAGADHNDAESLLNAATLLGAAPAGDFQLSAQVTVDFQAQYDAGVLLTWIDKQNWAKFCYEFSPAGDPMVVSVVTRGVSDDANAFVTPARSVGMRVSRIGRVYAYHASLDGKRWDFVRAFTLGDDLAGHRIGFEVQSPTGDGCRATFTDIRFTTDTLTDLRDGS